MRPKRSRGQTPRRIAMALAGAAVAAATIHSLSANAPAFASMAALAALLGWIIYRLLCSRDLNDVKIDLPAGEDLIGRTAKNHMLRDMDLTWYLKRGPLPFGYSAIVTTKRVSFYYESRWYQDIWFKDIISVKWTFFRSLDIHFDEGGMKRTIRVNTWGSYGPFLELLSKAGVAVPERSRG
jgi:hypothetical protein